MIVFGAFQEQGLVSPDDDASVMAAVQHDTLDRSPELGFRSD